MAAVLLRCQMSGIHIHRAPSDLLIESDLSSSLDRNLFHRLPLLQDLELLDYRQSSAGKAHCHPKLTACVREISDLQKLLYATLQEDPSLAYPFVRWTEKKGALDISHREIDSAHNLTTFQRFYCLLGSDRTSAWFQDLYWQHCEDHIACLEIFPDSVRQWKNDFIKIVRPLCSGGLIPVSDSVLASKIQSTKFTLLNYLDSPIGEISFDAQERKVVTTSVEFPLLEKIDAYHELFHALSGRAVLQIKDGSDELYFLQRSGLSIDCPFGDPQLASSFNWLNEAVTEKLARLIAPEIPVNQEGQPRPEPYDAEVKLLECLIDDYGISLQTFLAAYFEDHQTSSVAAYPSWQKLNYEFKLAFGIGGLRKLDAYIREYGVDAALNALAVQNDPSLIFANDGMQNGRA